MASPKPDMYDWHAEEDARVLKKGHEIRSDKPRHKRAIAHLVKEREALNAALADHVHDKAHDKDRKADGEFKKGEN